MTRLILAAVIGLTTALPAAAQFKNAEAAITYRQSVMQVQNHHLGRIFAMVNGRMPFDAKVAAEDAALLDTIDKLPFVAFIDGSDKGDTNAKPEIWKNMDDFTKKMEEFQLAAAKLGEVSAGGDRKAIEEQVKATGKTCGSCHDDYKEKDD